MYCVLDPVDSVVDGFLDTYGCVSGKDIQAARISQCLVVVEVSVLYASNEFEAVLEVCLVVLYHGFEGFGKQPQDALCGSVDV